MSSSFNSLCLPVLQTSLLFLPFRPPLILHPASVHHHHCRIFHFIVAERDSRAAAVSRGDNKSLHPSQKIDFLHLQPSFPLVPSLCLHQLIKKKKVVHPCWAVSNMLASWPVIHKCHYKHNIILFHYIYIFFFYFLIFTIYNITNSCNVKLQSKPSSLKPHNIIYNVFVLHD